MNKIQQSLIQLTKAPPILRVDFRLNYNSKIQTFFEYKLPF